MKLGKKILLSVVVIVVLTLIGVATNAYRNYYCTDDGKTKIYLKEIQGKLSLEGNKSVIKIIKCNFESDEREDYIALLGEEKYDETDTSKVKELKKFNLNLEMYNNVCIDYINSETFETKRYDTNKSYGVDVDIKFYTDDNCRYLLLSDTSTGNVSLLTLKSGEISNIISESFGNDFCGYTINASFLKDEQTKLKIVLDNYNRQYLIEKKDEYVLDFSDQETVNKDNYRITYMANKYSSFYLEDVDDDGVLEFICIQNLLYANNDTVKKNVGKVKLIYKINDEGKLQQQDVTVEK